MELREPKALRAFDEYDGGIGNVDADLHDRRGNEDVHFVFFEAPHFSIFLGGLAGLALGALISVLTYFGLLRIPGRYLFAVTSVMIALLAAGMAAQAVGLLEQANIVTAFSAVLWNSSGILSDSSLLGKVLHTLIGYNDQPSGMQVAVYLATLAITYVLMKLAAPTPIPAHLRR